MDAKTFIRKQSDRKMELLYREYKDEAEKAIIDLELIICSIHPYSRWWRHGYVKSLRRAIKALENEKKGARCND